MAAPAVMRHESQRRYRVSSRGDLLLQGRPTGYGVAASQVTRSEIQLLADMLNEAGPSITPSDIEVEWLVRCDALAMEARRAA